jgi:hypothetical protein
MADIFIARLGAQAGFWYEEYWDTDTSYYSYDDNWGSNLYFFGPKIRLEVGNKKVHFVIVDATLLIGSSAKALLNSGISLSL